MLLICLHGPSPFGIVVAFLWTCARFRATQIFLWALICPWTFECSFIKLLLITTPSLVLWFIPLKFMINVLQQLKVLLFDHPVWKHLNAVCPVYKTSRRGKETEPCYELLYLGHWPLEVVESTPTYTEKKHKMCLCTKSATITDLQADQGADIHTAH